MTVNASNVSPGLAIERCLMFIEGNLALANDNDNGDGHEDLLSLYMSGEPGVGKSAIAKALARRLGYKFVDRRANMMNPDDAGGTRMQDMEARQTVWFPPEWMPADDGSVEGVNESGPFKGQPYKGTFLFFDELASADDRVRKPLFGIFLDRELNGRKLPNNCVVAAAGNEADTGTMVFELDNATISRFITIRIVADFDSWVSDFAPSARITPTAISYLKQNIHRFCETERALSESRDLYGNPRSWHHVSKAELSIMRTPADRRDKDKRDALYDMVAGKVGTELAAEFMGVFDNVAEMNNLYDLLRASKEERRSMWPTSIGQLHALFYSMMAYPTSIEQAKQIISLADEMPTDHDLGFQEMRAPLLEIIQKRLKSLGIKGAEISKAFKKECEEVSQDIFAAGPLIRLG